MNATTKVIEGKLCVEVDGVKAWYTAAHIDRWIAKLEGELAKWKERRAMLATSKGTEPLTPLPTAAEPQEAAGKT